MPSSAQMERGSEKGGARQQVREVIAAPVGWERRDVSVQQSMREYVQPCSLNRKVFFINKFLSISRGHT